MTVEKQIVQSWFEVWEPEPGVFAIREPFHSEQVYSYLVTGAERAVLVDSGTGVGDIRAVVESLTAMPVFLLNSHSHWDHVGGNWRFDEIWIHQAEADCLPRGMSNQELRRWFAPEQLTAPLPDGYTVDSVEIRQSQATQLVSGGDVIDLGDRRLRILHAPGHSSGGIVVVDDDNGWMLSTDVVYAGPLYVYSDDSSLADYQETLQRLSEEATRLHTLLPSHGDSPIEPGIVPVMRDALEAITAGRVPDRSVDGRDIHEFDGFGVIVRANDPALRANR